MKVVCTSGANLPMTHSAQTIYGVDTRYARASSRLVLTLCITAARNSLRHSIHDPGVDREKSLTIVEGNKDFLVRKIPPVWTYPAGDVCTTKTLKTSLHVGLCIHTQGTSSCPTSGRERRGQLARPDLGIWIYLQEHGSWVEIDEYPSLSIPTNRSCI